MSSRLINALGENTLKTNNSTDIFTRLLSFQKQLFCLLSIRTLQRFTYLMAKNVE